MKRKIALLLAAVMTVAMLPMSAMADSSATLSRANLNFSADKVVVRGADIDVPEGRYDADDFASAQAITLDIRPTSSEVEYDSNIIILRVNNGKFDSRLAGLDMFNYHVDKSGQSWDTLIDEYVRRGANDDAAKQILESYIKAASSNSIPYKLTIVNEEEAEVELFPLPADVVNVNNSNYSAGYPTYKIALPITTEDSDEGNVTISIDGNGTSISDVDDRKVATVTDSDGSTTASVVASQVKVYSSDSIAIPNITIREDLAGTFDSQDIEVRVNGNFEIAGTNGVTAKVGVNDNKSSKESKEFTVTQKNSRTLVIHLKDAFLNTKDKPDAALHPNGSKKVFDTTTLSTIVVSGIVVIAKDDDTYGDVNMTISGDRGISTQTIKVAERADYGFKLEALEEPTLIYAGRTPFATDADEEDFVTAEFEFGETTPGTWLTGRKLEFSVPEGVKIVGYEITKKRNFTGSELFKAGDIVDGGTTLRFASLTGSAQPNGREAAYIDMKLYLSASIDFSGDVAVSVSGAGLDADTLSDLVVAKFVTPVTVEAATTKSNMGYKSVETADIKITENSEGALVNGKEVEITLDNTYSNDLAFDDTNIDYVIDGEVEIKSFKVKHDRNDNSNKITFLIDSESYSAPSTITITGVAVGTTRSIPYGSYSIVVGGEAIVDNYKDDVDQPTKVTVQDGPASEVNDDFDLFEEEGFEFKNYLQIVTDTTTLDGVVEVTIGEKSIKMDGQSYDMDVAAYIQTSSNSTMVPLRFVTLALGVDQASMTDADNTSKIAWDANTKTATIFYAAGSGQKIIQFQAGSAQMKVDGVEITMDNGVVSEIVDGRMFVPFRALGQALGVPVSWNADTRTAIYNEQLAPATTPAVDVEAEAEETTEAEAEAETVAEAE